jgi:RimJ/RimL family protein N-acetyltransferase
VRTYPGPVPEGRELVRRNAFGQPIGHPVAAWSRRPWPWPTTLTGRYCRVEPLQIRHAGPLYRALIDGSDDSIWTYLSFGPFPDMGAFEATVRSLVTDPGWCCFAIVDAADGATVGMGSFLRIDPQAGCLEVGALLYAPRLQRTTCATEAITLLAGYAFDQLGYRRLEWKCDALNEPSRRAALRLGFRHEGVFRCATVYKGRNRDTAWFAITHDDWPTVKRAHEQFLDPGNFDGDGRQRLSLSALTAPPESRPSA